jgi:hypothetical protein
MQNRVGQGPGGVLLFGRPILWLYLSIDLAGCRATTTCRTPTTARTGVPCAAAGRRAGPCRRAIRARSTCRRPTERQATTPAAHPPTSEQRSIHHRKSETTHPPAGMVTKLIDDQGPVDDMLTIYFPWDLHAQSCSFMCVWL